VTSITGRGDCCSLHLMRQILAHHPVKEGAEHGSRQKHNKHRIAAAHEDEHRRGAHAGERPAQSENEAADDVARIGVVFGWNNDFFAFCGAQVCAFDELHNEHARHHRCADDAVHVEGLKMEHLENAEPGNGFCFVKRDAEQDADEDIF
jgi:uncharacterized protein YprB with RNaseH-like and TPR domain